MKYLRLNKILEDVNDQEVINFETVNFSGGEKHIKLKTTVPATITIETQIKSSDCIMKLLLATDALKRQGAKDISLIMPYVPYGRQDRIMVQGEPLSIKVFTDLINVQSYKEVYTLDNHSAVTGALIDRNIEIDNSRILSMLFLQNGIIVSPDAGSLKKCTKIAGKFGLKLVLASKIRDVKTGEIRATKVQCQDLKGLPCYIIDDICDGGKTFIELAKILKKRGAGKIILYVSHGIFSKGISLIEKYINEIYTTINFYSEQVIILPLRKEDLKWSIQ